MSRKKIFIIIAAFLIVILAFVIFLISNSINKNSDDTRPKIETQNIEIEVGLEELKNISISAIESYASQNIKETNNERAVRLKKLFIKNSAVYDKKPESINDTVYKTSAKVKKIEHLVDSSEGVQKILIVHVILTCYYSGGTYEIDKAYWLSLAEQEDGSYIPFDAGEYFE